VVGLYDLGGVKNPSSAAAIWAKSKKQKMWVTPGVNTVISMQQRVEFAGLSPDEVVTDVAVSKRHAALLASYLLNIHRGAVNVRQMIVADLRGFLDLGMRDRASDALVILRIFLSNYPEARSAPLSEGA
jgi:hypothetical protein